jgi:hypothetical protein
MYISYFSHFLITVICVSGIIIIIIKKIIIIIIIIIIITKPSSSCNSQNLFPAKERWNVSLEAHTSCPQRSQGSSKLLQSMALFLTLKMSEEWSWLLTSIWSSSSPGGGKNFLFSTSSRPVLGPTQPPFQWVPGTLWPEVKRPGREADHSLPISAKVKKTWIYPSTPPYSYVFTGTTLPLLNSI